MSDDWRDPFSEDERDAERERRRAERAAKRRDRKEGTRQSLGDRVREQLSGGPAEPDEPAEPPAAGPPTAAPPAETAPTPPPADPAQPATPPVDPPPADPPTEQQSTPSETAERPAAPPAVPVPPPDRTAEHDQATDFFDGGATDFYEIEDQPIAVPPTSKERIETARAKKLRRRRFGAFAFLLVILAVVGAGAYAYKHRNDDAPAPQPAPKPRKTFEVTIPEGYTRADMAGVAKTAGLKGDYMKASIQSKKIDLADYGAKNAKNLEGFLFPATYDLFKGATAQDLVDKQVEAFKQNFDPISEKYAKSKNLTPYDVVIIASMIEREIQVPKERALAASVIYNRLKQGTPLGIDATIRYEDDNFTQPLLESRLQEDTPYNTRINTGLPPGPIGNPGVDSLEAAAKPADTKFFFYVVKPDTCGEHAFVKTQAEFDQATAEYNSAREAAGGKSPTNC